MDKNDADTIVLQEKVAELERWRADLEDRIQKRTDVVEQKFEDVGYRITGFENK